MSLIEINFDGIVGPSHNYAGLSLGNIASDAAMRAMRPIRAPRRCRASPRCAATWRSGWRRASSLPLPRPNTALAATTLAARRQRPIRR